MKTSKTLRRLAAAVLAGTMMLAMGTTAFAAEETTSVTSVELTKKVTAEENVLAPKTEFTFTVAPVTEDVVKDGVTVAYKGITNGAKFDTGADTITFGPETELTGATTITLDASVFEKPGVYRYLVDETEGSYDGITYDTTQYYLDLYVVNANDGGTEFVVKDVRVYNVAAPDVKATALAFDNAYDTNNLTLTKVVTGNQANMAQKFEFKVTINGAEGENYTVVAGETESTMVSGEEATFNLGNGESITIYGLSAEDTYTIVETDYTSDGYVTTIEGADAEDDLTATGKVDDKDDEVTYTNTKEVSTPTGIITNVLPYVLMVVAAAALAFVFLRKREYNR